MIYLVCASEAHSAVCVWFLCGPQSDNEGVVLQIVDNGTVTDHSWAWLVVGCLGFDRESVCMCRLLKIHQAWTWVEHPSSDADL